MADNDKEFISPVDVSEPYDQPDETEIIEEAMAISRRDWIRRHKSYIFAVIGVIIVGLTAFFIYRQFQSNSPTSRFSASLSKDFGVPFHFDVRLTKDDADVMRFDGEIDVDRSNSTLRAVYQADYNRYSYTGAVYADDKNRVKGSLYQKEWTVQDCADQVTDFFDFDKDFRSGRFDGGAFLRFTGLANDYSTDELNRFVKVLKDRLSTDSAIAAVTTEKGEGETRFSYTVNLYELLKMVDENGASVFYRASDYNKFSETFSLNKSVLENAQCEAEFVISDAGYMTSFDLSVIAEGTKYGLSCRMSDFGTAEVEIPEAFLEEAISPTEEETSFPVR